MKNNLRSAFVRVSADFADFWQLAAHVSGAAGLENVHPSEGRKGYVDPSEHVREPGSVLRGRYASNEQIENVASVIIAG